MAQHSLPQGREFLRLGELREKRQLSFFCDGGEKPFAVFSDTQKPGVEMAAVFRILLYIFLKILVIILIL